MRLSERLQYFIEYYKDPQKVLLRAVQSYNNPQYVRLLEFIIKLEDDKKILEAGIDYLVSLIRVAHPQPIELKRNPDMTVKEWLEKEIYEILNECLKEINNLVMYDIEDTGRSNWNSVPGELQNKIENKAYTLRKNLLNARPIVKSTLYKYMNQYSKHFDLLVKDLFKNIDPGDSIIF